MGGLILPGFYASPLKKILLYIIEVFTFLLADRRAHAFGCEVEAKFSLSSAEASLILIELAEERESVKRESNLGRWKKNVPNFSIFPIFYTDRSPDTDLSNFLPFRFNLITN